MHIQSIFRLLIRGFRKRRMHRFAHAFTVTDATSVIDVGGTPLNWEFLQAAPAVTLLNLDTPAADPELEHLARVIADGTRLPYADRSFDVAFSNSVIEHLGTAKRRSAFARELRRVGKGVWVQTPARSFFLEPHFLTPFVHFLPRHWRRRVLRNGTLWGWVTRPTQAVVDRFVESTELLGLTEMRRLFPDCEIRRERFLGMTKAYVAVRGAVQSGPVRFREGVSQCVAHSELDSQSESSRGSS